MISLAVGADGRPISVRLQQRDGNQNGSDEQEGTPAVAEGQLVAHASVPPLLLFPSGEEDKGHAGPLRWTGANRERMFVLRGRQEQPRFGGWGMLHRMPGERQMQQAGKPDDAT